MRTRIRPDDRIPFELRIPGAKVTERSSQPSLRTAIDGSSLVTRVLEEVLEGCERMMVRKGAKRLNADFADIREMTGLKISPCAVRHQTSANLKAEFRKEQAERVAEVLGDVTTRSQGRYGSVRQAQASGSGIVGMKAERAVKETRPARRPRSTPEPA